EPRKIADGRSVEVGCWETSVGVCCHFALLVMKDEVAPGPERQLAAAAARALEDVEGAHNEVEGDQAIMTPFTLLLRTTSRMA
ncbi:hypothetical protein Tco_1131725, partial [Tanacetum coccineum]